MLQYNGFNDYAVEVYKDKTLIGVLDAVTNLSYVRLWLNIQASYRSWTSIRVFHRETHTLIGTYSKAGIFPAKPMV